MKQNEYNRIEKLDRSLDAVNQQEPLRALCCYLLDEKKAKKTGSYRIKPIPLFNKDSGTNEPIDSIDVVTGNGFLRGKLLSTTSASKLMHWLDGNFSGVFASEKELRQQRLKYWRNLLGNKTYQHAFMRFCLASDRGVKCIEAVGLQQSLLENLPRIKSKEHFYLQLSGKPEDHFFIVLESFNEKKVFMQLAPLSPAYFFPDHDFISSISADRTTLKYPLKASIPLSEKYGLGRWRCTAIRSAMIPIAAKTIAVDPLLSSFELADFVARLMQQDKAFAIDSYEFVLFNK